MTKKIIIINNNLDNIKKKYNRELDIELKIQKYLIKSIYYIFLLYLIFSFIYNFNYFYDLFYIKLIKIKSIHNPFKILYFIYNIFYELYNINFFFKFFIMLIMSIFSKNKY